MAKCMQCGGATKMKKMQKGGSAEIVGMPKYGNNPRTEQGRMLKDGGSIKTTAKPSKPIKTTSKSSAELKRNGSVQKAKGVAMKAKGQAMKYEGQQQKNNSLGIHDKLATRGVATAIKLKESVFGSKNRGLTEQKILDTDMSIHKANKARNENETKQVKEMQNKGGYSKAGFKKGGTVKKMAKGGFPDLNKDGKITKADILKGRGVIKRKGGAIKKK